MASAIASIILAAGKGSRMHGFDGNKTLLPLVPGKSPFQGARPILLHILEALPPGPKAVVVHHKKEEVIEATQGHHLEYFIQPVLNGTGGALLAAREFVEREASEWLVITMGDVPFVKKSTYLKLTSGLSHSHMALLSFKPREKRQYGVVELDKDRVRRITEWKYWREYPRERQEQLDTCNSGIYAVRTRELVHYLPILSARPHRVTKERDGIMTEIQEFFITDLVEWMDQDGLKVTSVLAEDENEVMGIDDLAALQKAQRYYRNP